MLRFNRPGPLDTGLKKAESQQPSISSRRRSSGIRSGLGQNRRGTILTPIIPIEEQRVL